MRGGLLIGWSGAAVVGLLSACSNIIGISSYEIDPTLDGGGSAAGGKKSDGGSRQTAGEPSSNDAGAPAAAGDGSGGTDTGGTGSAGMDSGGSSNGGSTSGSSSGGSSSGGSSSGGTSHGGSSNGGSSNGGSGGSGGQTTTGCLSAKDCDDTIDCTTDSCGGNGVCVHTPKDTLCDSTQCETCTIGIGCVAGPKTVTQLLVDPNFDLNMGDWDDSGSDAPPNIVVSATAQSGTRVAKFGPGLQGAKTQQYSDLLQIVTIPAGTVALTLTGYYKLTSGLTKATEDYVAIGFWEPGGGTMPFSQFHSFAGNVGPTTTWKAFTYSAAKSEVAQMGGLDYSFDLVANTWSSAYQFDSLAVNATVCK